jgi:hypothetical protein
MTEGRVFVSYGMAWHGHGGANRSDSMEDTQLEEIQRERYRHRSL